MLSNTTSRRDEPRRSSIQGWRRPRRSKQSSKPSSILPVGGPDGTPGPGSATQDPSPICPQNSAVGLQPMPHVTRPVYRAESAGTAASAFAQTGAWGSPPQGSRQRMSMHYLNVLNSASADHRPNPDERVRSSVPGWGRPYGVVRLVRCRRLCRRRTGDWGGPSVCWTGASSRRESGLVRRAGTEPRSFARDGQRGQAGSHLRS
jgi:hypothetical protein